MEQLPWAPLLEQQEQFWVGWSCLRSSCLRPQWTSQCWKFTGITISHADQYHVYSMGRKGMMLLTSDVPLWVESLPYMWVITDKPSILVSPNTSLPRKGLNGYHDGHHPSCSSALKALEICHNHTSKTSNMQPPVSWRGSHGWQNVLLYGSVIGGIAMYLSCDMVLGEIAKMEVIKMTTQSTMQHERKWPWWQQ